MNKIGFTLLEQIKIEDFIDQISYYLQYLINVDFAVYEEAHNRVILNIMPFTYIKERDIRKNLKQYRKIAHDYFKKIAKFNKGKFNYLNIGVETEIICGLKFKRIGCFSLTASKVTFQDINFVIDIGTSAGDLNYENFKKRIGVKKYIIKKGCDFEKRLDKKNWIDQFFPLKSFEQCI